MSKDPYHKTCRYEHCRTPFVAKRLNQEYHSPECKKKANNNKARDERKLIYNIEIAIKRNRRILEYFHSNGNAEVDNSDLQLNGFDHSASTGILPSKDGKYRIPQYFNYTLEKAGDNKFKIVKL